MKLIKKSVTVELSKCDIDLLVSVHSQLFSSCSDNYDALDFMTKEQRHILFNLLHNVTEYELA